MRGRRHENSRDVGRAWKKWGGMGGKESISPPSRVHVPVRPQTTPWPAREEKDTVAKEAPEWRQEAYACAPQHTQATPRGERGGGGGRRKGDWVGGKKEPNKEHTCAESYPIDVVVCSRWCFFAFFFWVGVGGAWLGGPFLSFPFLVR